jgi:hypothetical protein
MNTPFCTDVDLLHWEPNIFRDAAVSAVLLLSGKADLQGTELTCTWKSNGCDTLPKNINVDDVVVLAGEISGSFPITAVSGPRLTISVLYDGLFPDRKDGSTGPIGTTRDVAFSIRTFTAQRQCISNLMLAAAGVTDGLAAIVNTQALRRPCAIGTLQMIYNALAAASSAPEQLRYRADLYERLYRRTLSRCRLELDTNGDGKADEVRTLNALELASI